MQNKRIPDSIVHQVWGINSNFGSSEDDENGFNYVEEFTLKRLLDDRRGGAYTASDDQPGGRGLGWDRRLRRDGATGDSRQRRYSLGHRRSKSPGNATTLATADGDDGSGHAIHARADAPAATADAASDGTARSKPAEPAGELLSNDIPVAWTTDDGPERNSGTGRCTAAKGQEGHAELRRTHGVRRGRGPSITDEADGRVANLSATVIDDAIRSIFEYGDTDGNELGRFECDFECSACEPHGLSGRGCQCDDGLAQLVAPSSQGEREAEQGARSPAEAHEGQVPTRSVELPAQVESPPEARRYDLSFAQDPEGGPAHGGLHPPEGQGEGREGAKVQSKVKGEDPGSVKLHRISQRERDSLKLAAEARDRDFAADLWAMDDRADLIEICVGPESPLSAEMMAQGRQVLRVGLFNGFDMTTAKGCSRAVALVQRHRPKDLWFSPMCGAWSTALNGVLGNEASAEKVATARKVGRRTLLYCLRVMQAAKAVDANCHMHLEQPAGALSWSEPILQRIIRQMGMKLVTCTGCSFGLRHPISGGFVLKRWWIATTDEGLVDVLSSRQCTKQHKHHPLSGGRDTRWSERYPPAMVRTIARRMCSRRLAWSGFVEELRIAESENLMESELAENCWSQETY